MKDVQTVLEAYRAAQQSQIPCALATVVSVDGSAYRRPGARMLVYADGRRFGSLSGGCLEADVAAHALQTLETGKPKTVRYDPNHANGDVILETGCKGSIGILVEPVARLDTASSLVFLSQVFHGRHAGMMATVFEVEGSTKVHAGDRLMISSKFQPVAGALCASPLADSIVHDAAVIQGNGRAAVSSYALPEGTVHVLLETLRPPVALVICGAGHDTVPLAKIATAMGWLVTVADSNGAALTAERYPDVPSLLPIPPACLTAHLSPDSRTAAVIMTHRYNLDMEWFRELLPSAMTYLGVLGPRRRWRQMQVDLAAGGDVFSEQDIARVHSPAGLDIGSETPEEIAMAIVAEIQAVMAARSGGFLRNRDVAMHIEGRENTSSSSLAFELGGACPL
ncbi:MAG: xanthine dehydrogenase [Chthonomonadaceae bacterium]|nr:xanthine dehydrogenase [Chthonomonadaceae bacterium]